jgi:hypothetical protein
MENPKLALSAPDSLVQKLTAISEKWYLIHTRNIRSELATYKQQSPSLAGLSVRFGGGGRLEKKPVKRQADRSIAGRDPVRPSFSSTAS